jgi:peptidoglycan hydrolase-like protein with peptidoglycan-binding domain
LKKSKRIWIVLIVPMLFFFSGAQAENAKAEVSPAAAVSEAPGIPLEDLLIEQLLTLRDQVDQALMKKGYVAYTALEKGDKGEAVARLQEKLAALGYYTGAPTGKFDYETQKAMKAFEKANDLKNDGAASIEDLTFLFWGSPAPAQTPTPSSTPVAKPDVTENPLYEAYELLDYTEISRYPDEYAGQKVELSGTVVQVLGSREEGFQIRLATENGYDEIVYIFVSFDPGYNILESDQLIVYARLTKTVTYEAIWGQSVTVPSAEADYITLL